MAEYALVIKGGKIEALGHKLYGAEHCHADGKLGLPCGINSGSRRERQRHPAHDRSPRLVQAGKTEPEYYRRPHISL